MRDEVRAIPRDRSGHRRVRTVAVAALLDDDRRAAARGNGPASARGCTTSMLRRRSSRPTRSTRRRCTASRATIKATATTTSTFRSTSEQYLQLVADLRTLPTPRAERFRGRRRARYFEGCLPIEEMADRGDDTLRFGPLKPVGLRDPRTGTTPYAVVQLRKENVGGHRVQPRRLPNAPDVARAKGSVRKTPGLANAEWLRLGVMHRNTFIDSPRLLDAKLSCATRRTLLRGTDHRRRGLRRSGRLRRDGRNARGARDSGLSAIEFPRETAFGAVVAHLQNTATPDFQPANVTWASFPPPANEVQRQKGAAARAGGARAGGGRCDGA